MRGILAFFVAPEKEVFDNLCSMPWGRFPPARHAAPPDALNRFSSNMIRFSECTKLIYSHGIIFRFLPKYCPRKFRLVDGIGKILGFQAHSRTKTIGSPILTCLLVNKIPCIELYAGQRGIAFHHSAGGYPQCGEMAQFSVPSVYYPVVVISACEFQLFELGTDFFSDSFQASEIHGCSSHFRNLPGGYGAGIRRGITGCFQLQFMSLYVSAVMPLQVKIGMIGQVQNRPSVTDAVIVESQRI